MTSPTSSSVPLGAAGAGRLLDFFAPCPLSVEDLLAEELTRAGASAVKVTRAGVRFQAGVETALRVCLWSRVASRLLMPLASFEAGDAAALYEGTFAIPWEDHLDPSSTLAVEANVSDSRLTHTGFVALKVKDAIVDRQRNVCGARSAVRPLKPDVKIDLHLHRDVATVSLDLSGEAMSHRGYRVRGGEAPLRENLAAAVLLRAGWPECAERGWTLLDPMCGTGTLLIEGAAMAADIAPGLARRYFGFLGWKQFPRAAWQALLEEARLRAQVGLDRVPPVFGYDADPVAVRAAAANAAAAGLASVIQLAVRPIAELEPPAGIEAGLVVVNPPYGRRVGRPEELAEVYATLGLRLRQSFGGWNAAVLVEEEEWGRRLGLRAHKMHRVYNGAVPCRLLHFKVGTGFQTLPTQRTRAQDGDSRNEDLVNRLRKNLKHLGRWARREGVTCFRVYDRDLPEFNFAIDLYEDWALVQEYAAPADVEARTARRRRDAAFAAVSEVLQLEPSRIFFRLRSRQKGNTQYERQASTGRMREVHEGGLRFLVNPTDYLDCGLFLDHRPTRALLRTWARGARVLNLFCYTGTASVYAAAGGAASTTSVDMSRTYLAWAADNFRINGFVPTLLQGDALRSVAQGRHGAAAAQHRLVRADCLEWLGQAGLAPGVRFDLVFADVPTFSNSKRMEGTFDVARDHVAFLAAVAKVLAPGGRILFSTNRRRFILDEAGLHALAGLLARDITARTIPPDFARHPHVHRCWVLVRA